MITGGAQVAATGGSTSTRSTGRGRSSPTRMSTSCSNASTEYADALHGPGPRGRRHLLRELDDVPVSAPGGSILTERSRRVDDLGPDPEQLVRRQPDPRRRPDPRTSPTPASALVTGNTLSQLTFSSLTPDLSITAMTVSGGTARLHCSRLNTDIQVTATIRNIGQVNAATSG